MRIGILTTIWGRPELTELVINYYNDLDVPGVELVCLGVFSSDDSHTLITEKVWDRWYGVEHPNQPLSDKWNHGMKEMREYDVDAVIIVGSDDLISVKYIQACAHCVSRAKQYVYLPGCYFLDLETQDCIWAYARRLGLGRCLSRSLLDDMDWQPWPSGVKEGLDGEMAERMRKFCPDFVNVRFAKEEGYAAIDIKGGHNMWSYDFVKENLYTEAANAHEVLNTHFPSIAHQLLNWNASTTARPKGQIQTG